MCDVFSRNLVSALRRYASSSDDNITHSDFGNWTSRFVSSLI